VRQLWPLAFNNSSHFIRDVVDVLDLQACICAAVSDLAADDAGLIDAALLGHSRRQLFANAVIAASLLEIETVNEVRKPGHLVRP
jgi:hypothetical protein